MKAPFSLIILFLLSLVVPSAMAGLRVVEDAPGFLVVSVTPDDWDMEQLAGGEVPFPGGAGVDDRKGMRALPVYRSLVGLPSNNLPEINIERIQWGEWTDGLPPMGAMDSENERIPALDRGQTVLLGKPYLWRGRWVTGLYVVPLRVEGSGVRKLREVEFRLTYPSNGGRGVSGMDRLARTALLNPRAASAWGRVQRTPLLRSVAEWPQGEMIRIELESEGIYKITREALEQAGIDLSGYDPRTFRIYGNGGYTLDEDPQAPRDSALIENAIMVEGEEDGSWDPGDKIIFFGRSVNSWIAYTNGDYRHTKNPFTLKNVYWLNVPEDGSPGKRMVSLEPDDPPVASVDTARSRLAVENDIFIFHSENTPESGKRWYASHLYGGQRYTISFQAEKPVTDQPLGIVVGIRNLASGTDSVIVELNGVSVGRYLIRDSVKLLDVPAGVLYAGNNEFSIQLQSGHGLFDWFEVDYPRLLEADGSPLFFDIEPDGVTELTVSGIEQPWIFDIEDFADVRYTRSNPFRVEASQRRYIALSEDNFLTPDRILRDPVGGLEYPDGLRDPLIRADYIFIVHEDFWDASTELENYIEQRDGSRVIRVLISDVFKEFSWGVFDPTAIRDFLKYANENWAEGDMAPYACLLIGDGDYDYRNIVSNNDKNWIPPYEENLDCRDDWFTEFTVSGDPEYIISRLPFQKASELESYIARLEDYENNREGGFWRSKVILVADDEWVVPGGPTSIDKQHITYSEQLARDYIPIYAQVKKIYLGTYPTEYDPTTGERIKPLATQDLLYSINQGALIINYMGHGNAHVWAHESLFLDSRDLNLVNSVGREPIYVAATCSWGHYDRPDNEAFFEMLMGKNGGTLGVIAATRNTSGFSNFSFIKKFYEYFFERENARTLGESLFLAKLNSTGTSRHYHCFGEGMMLPALPRLDMAVTRINPDSLVALETGEIAGKVQEVPAGGLLSLPGDSRTRPTFDGQSLDFNGEALVTVFDSYDSLVNEFYDGSKLWYRTPGATLFRGMVSVREDTLVSRFMVPRNVSYGSADSWIQLYAIESGEQKPRDAIGSRQNVPISSVFVSLNDIVDTEPPEIEINFDHRGWRDGDLTSAEPLLILDLTDQSGIDLTGEIGHDIKAIIDPGEDREKTVTLTDNFVYELDSSTVGTAEETIFGLDSGSHTLEIWAWDNANNLARKQVTFFTVEDDEVVQLRNVLNVPNPFTDNTNFTFESVGADEAVIKIFTASGRHVKTIGPVSVSDQFNYIGWDGRDQYGDPVANGVYLYKVEVRGGSGQKEETLGKMIRVR